MTETPIPERVATLEEKTRTHDKEIESLRDTRDEHANHIQVAVLAVGAIPKLREDVDVVCDRTTANEREIAAMTTFASETEVTLRAHAAEIRKTRETSLKQTTNFGWVMRILTFVLLALAAVAQAVMIQRLTQVLDRAGNAVPVSAPAKTGTAP